MATYPDPDAFFDQSQVDWGNGGGTESIRSNLKSTNGAVYRIEPAVKDVAQAVAGLPASAADAVATRLLDGESMPYENQTPPDGQAPAVATVRTFLTATNGQVYRNADTLSRIEAKLDKVLAALASGGQGN